MLRDFLFDILLLRQGRKVSESAAHMHSLPQGCEGVASWTDFLTHAAPRDDFMLLGADRQSAQRRVRDEITFHERVLSEAGQTKASTTAMERTTQVLRVVAETLGSDTAFKDYETTGPETWDHYCSLVVACLDAACDARERLGEPEFCAARHGAALGEALYTALMAEEHNLLALWMLHQGL